MTTELERIKILGGKISQLIEYINRLVAENEKMKQQVKELKAEKKGFEEQAKRADKLDQKLRVFSDERKEIIDKVETIISQIDQLGI